MPYHLHLDGGVIFGDHLVHEQGHVGDVCSKILHSVKDISKTLFAGEGMRARRALSTVQHTSRARPEDSKGKMNGMRGRARDGDRKEGRQVAGERGEWRVPGQR